MLMPLHTHGHDFLTCKAVAGCARGFRAKEPVLERWLQCGLGVGGEGILGGAVGEGKSWRNGTFGRVAVGGSGREDSDGEGEGMKQWERC